MAIRPGAKTAAPKQTDAERVIRAARLYERLRKLMEGILKSDNMMRDLFGDGFEAGQLQGPLVDSVRASEAGSAFLDEMKLDAIACRGELRALGFDPDIPEPTDPDPGGAEEVDLAEEPAPRNPPAPHKPSRIDLDLGYERPSLADLKRGPGRPPKSAAAPAKPPARPKRNRKQPARRKTSARK